MSEIRITLETLYDILRNEKKSEELQTVEETFFADVVTYLTEKKSLLGNKLNDDDIFASTERDKIDHELRSIKRILKEIYEKREKKIIEIALNKSRTRSDLIDTSSMQEEEKMFYDKVLALFNSFRRGVIGNILQAKMPSMSQKPEEIASIVDRLDKQYTQSKILNPNSRENSKTAGKNTAEEKNPELSKSEILAKSEETAKSDEPKISTGSKTPTNQASEVKVPTNSTATTATPESSSDLPKTKIRFIHPMPSFVWKDMKEYGPFDTGEETEMYSEVAELLIRKGRAEIVKV